MDKFRPYQKRAVDALRAGLRAGHKHQMLTAPCGFGKSYMAAHIMIESAKRTGRTSYFVADRTVLIEQAFEAVVREVDGMDVGVIQADHPMQNEYAQIQICTIQSLAARSRAGWPVHAGIIFIDEAHVFYKHHRELMDACQGVPVIGMSATPLTPGLGQYYTNLVNGASVRELIADGHLVDLVAYSPSRPDLSGLRVARGDYETGKLSERMRDVKLVGDVVKTYQRLGQGRPFICFAVDINHSKVLAAKFADDGISVKHIDGYADRDEKKTIFGEFKSGTIQGLVSVGMTSYGFDAPICSCAILARPTKSLMLHEQQLGRVMRSYPGKEHSLILDHTGNMQDFPLPKDFEVLALNNGKEGEQSGRLKSAKPPRYCAECGAEVKCNPCEHCGYEIVVKPRDKVKSVPGELQRMGAGPDGGNDRQDEFIGMAKHYAKARGKSPKFWLFLYKQKYKTWPASGADQQAEIHPDEAFMGWITHLNIKYARRKRG